MIPILNKREQKIFVICLAVVSTAVFYNGLFVPLERKKNSVDQEIVVAKKQLNRSVRIIQKAQKLNPRYHYYQKYFSESGTEEAAASLFLSEIEKVAGKLKLHVAQLKPRKIKYDKFSHHFSVSLTIDSQLVDVIEFLHILQQSPHLFDVEEAELEKSMRKNQKTITARLVLGKAFILRDSHQRKESQDTGSAPL